MINKLKNTVLSGDYCIGCGICACYSKNISIKFDEYGKYIAVLNCNNENICDQSIPCPFANDSPNEDEIATNLFKNNCKQHSAETGYYNQLLAAYVVSNDFRINGSSGGCVSWLLCEMLNAGLVKKVIHVGQNPNRKNPKEPIFKYKISSTKIDIKRSAKSKYYPAELSEVLESVRNDPGPYAFVGVPCFVKAIRLVAYNDTLIRNRIKYCIGLVCGHLKSSHFADLFAWQCGIKPGDIGHIDFRVKNSSRKADQYGITVISWRNPELRVTKPNFEFFGHLWGYGFFKYNACDYCDDVFAETADITFGDAWLPQYRDDGMGTNIIILRNPELTKIILNGILTGKVKANQISLNDIIKSQHAGIRHKREGLKYRIFLKQKNKLWYPPKRVPANHKFNRRFKQIQKCRMELSQRSHIVFKKAIDINDFSFFYELMSNIIKKYDNLYRPQLFQKISILSKKSLRQFLKNHILKNTSVFFIQKIKKKLELICFFHKYSHLRSQRKFFYVLTPPSSLSNIGDHAQVVAIREWFKKHFSGIPILEFDKNEVHSLYWAIKFLARPNDIFFIHSGGNLGDRGIWSENGRRKIISGFRKNQIISLPQTIYFSNSKKGQIEKKISQKIYAKHPNLTIIGRDYESGKIANELFSKAKTFSMPDFVLSLDSNDQYITKIQVKEKKASKIILLCLRKDNESKLSTKQFIDICKILTLDSEYYDTTLDESIDITNRKSLLINTLKYFSSFDAVVTDRYHGLIFSVICRIPTVVIPTVDHKLTSAFDWFETINFVEYVDKIDRIPDAILRVLAVNKKTVIDWNKEYFDKLPDMIGLKCCE